MAEYPIGFLGTPNTFMGFQSVYAAQTAIRIFNNKSHPLTQTTFPGIDFTISMPIVDTGLEPLLGVNEAYKLIESGLYNHFAPTFPMEPVLGLIGPRVSDVAKPVSLLASIMDIPILSHAATSPDMSDKDQYPSFCRMIPSANVATKILGDYIKHFGWTRIAILTCDTDDCVEYTDAMLKQTGTYGYEVPVVSSVISSRGNLGHEDGETPAEIEEAIINDLQKAMELIKANNIRVIVVAQVGNVIPKLYKVMESMGLYTEDINHGHVIITRQGSDTIASSLFNNVEDQQHRSGQLTLRYKWPSLSNPLYSAGLSGEWTGTVSSFLGSAAPLAESVGKWMGWAAIGKHILKADMIPMAFDAVMVYFKAIYNLEMSGIEVTRKNLKSAISNVVMLGATGMIQFDENCDRNVEFELINLRDDLPVMVQGAGEQTHDWHSVATWTPPGDGETFGSIQHNDQNPINWGTGLDNLGVTPPDYMAKPSKDESISAESLILIAVGSVAAVFAIAFFMRYIKQHYVAHEGAERFDANKKQKQRVMWNIVKALGFFAIEILDFVTDALSASSVFSLMGEDVVSPIFVILYLCIICIAGIANFGSSIARTKNFIDLIKEYREGISITSAAGHGEEAEDDGSATMNEVNLLKQQSLYEDVERLELLSVRKLEVRRLIRVEKFVVLLGFVEDLPFAIMNSILILFHRDSIDFAMIYISTLLTCLGFGMKLMSFRIIYILNAELKELKEQGVLQRTYSVGKCARKLSLGSEQRQLSLMSVVESKDEDKMDKQDDTIRISAKEPKPLRIALTSVR